MNKKYEIDMTSGGILGNMLVFIFPLMFSSILQILYNAADIVVVGRFAGTDSLAAVGSTGNLVNLIINLFIGLSVGANIVVARFYGAKKEEHVSRTVHTSIAVSIIAGIAVGIFGVFMSRTFLSMMSTPTDVLDKATVYTQIYFAGMPSLMVFNFGASVLRAAGDTKRPLYYLSFSGVINVLLNLLFVIVFKMDVAGVALATIIAQTISAVLVVRCLIKTDGCFHLDIKKLRIHKQELIAIAKIGLPAGIQGSIFSISNVLIQSSINSFGKVALAGNTAAANIENFVYASMNAVYQATVTFTSQNYGAGHYKRIKKVLFYGLGTVMVIGLGMGLGAHLFSGTLVGIYTDNPEAITYGMERLAYVCLPYFLCGIMEVLVGSLRGVGFSVTPMIVSLIGACGFRIVWIYTFFRQNHTLNNLYISYPISWILTAAAHLVCLIIIMRRVGIKLHGMKK